MGRITIPTNCMAIDELLGGGLRTGTLLLAYGEAETGKTTLALQLAVNCAGMGHKALFVDCDGALRPEKVRAMTGGDPLVLENLTIARPSTFEEQAVLIDSLVDFASAGLTFLAVDTMTTLYRLKLSEEAERESDEEKRREIFFAMNRELARQMGVLAEMAHSYDMAIVVTSQVRARPSGPALMGELGSVEPVASRIMKFWADVVLCLRLSGQPGLRIAALEKSQILGLVGATRLFRITGEGVVDV